MNKVKSYVVQEYIFLVGIFIAFNLMLTLYLYEFNSGAVAGGGMLRFILKIIAVFLLFLSQPFPSKILMRKNSSLILAFSLFLISYVIYIPFSSWNELQFFNMYFVIFILFGIGFNQKFVAKFNYLLVYIYLFIWLPVDTYTFLSGNNLWENKAFIGGIGNPSSYGMIIIYMILINKNMFKPNREALLNILLITTLFFTQALMPILIMFVLSWFIFKSRDILLILGSLAYIFLIHYTFILESLGVLDIHWFLKLRGLFEYGLSSSNESGGVFVRLEYWKDLNRLFEDPLVLLFGHVRGVSYNGGDGQYVAYLTSFGLPVFLIFVFSIFETLFGFKFSYFKNGFRMKLFFVVFLLILITNRYLDYWPNAIVIFLLINQLNIKKHEYWNNKPISI